MKKLNVGFIGSLLLLLFITTNSCKKSEDNSGSYSSINVVTSISGIVLNEMQQPIYGADVTFNGNTTQTDSNGIFVFNKISVNRERASLQVKKSGFFMRTHAFVPVSAAVSYCKISMTDKVIYQTVSSSIASTVTLADNSSIRFQANSFSTLNGVAYSGNVNIVFKHLSPMGAFFSNTIPGSDLKGKNTKNATVALLSYGMLGVELTGSSGESLQLSTGKTAIISLPLATSQIANAPASMALWYFDENTSYWKEEGNATLQGTNYVGEVSHFSWWNIDYPGYAATIQGKLEDCNNIPLMNASITITGGGYSTVVQTDQFGIYQTLVPAGLPVSFTVQCLSNANQGIYFNSQIENVPSNLSVNQVYIVRTLEVLCPIRITGTINPCNSVVGTAIVSAKWNGGYAYQFCNTGVFSIAVPPGVAIALKLYYGSTFQDTNFITPLLSNTISCGSFTICPSSNPVNPNQPDNSFYINGIGYNNQFILIDTTYTSNTKDSTIGFLKDHYIVIQGIGLLPAVPGISIYINLNDTLNANYTYPNSGSGILINASSYSTDSIPPLFSCNISQFGQLGGRTKGFFSGAYRGYDSNGIFQTFFITNGKFNVARR